MADDRQDIAVHLSQVAPWWGRLRVLIPSALALLLATAALLGLHLRHLALSALEDTRHQAVSLARVLADDMAATLLGTDRVLVDVIEDFPLETLTGAANPRLHDFLRHHVVQTPYLYTVSLIDSHGMSVNTSLEGRPPLNLSTREYFIAHRDSPSPDLRVGKMAPTATTGEWALWVSRRLSRPDGAFAGVVSAAISPAYLANFYDAVRGNKDCALGLYTTKGIVLARQPLREADIGRDIGSAPLYTELLPRSPSGVFETVSPVDGVRRIVGYQQLANLPLVVTAGLSEEVALGGVRDQELVFAAIFTLVAVMVAALVALGRLLALHRASEYALAQTSAEAERFAEILAHHFQEPVRLQHAFASRLAKVLPQPLGADAERALRYVVDGAKRLRALTEDVQLYVAAPILARAQAPVPAGPAFAAAFRHVEPHLTQLGATVTVGELPSLPIAEARQVEIFREMLQNAIEYRRPDRPLVIDVSAERSGGAFVVSVMDNGIGIAPQYRERVFRVFERLHHNDQHPGTGVGLSLIKKIVEAVGGRVWIDEGLDGGTCVRFTVGRG